MSKQYASYELNVLLQQGINYDKANDTGRAEQCYQGVLKREPRHPYALYLLGVIAYRRTNYSDAIELITKAVQSKSNEHVFHLYLGNALRESERLHESIRSYDQLLSLKPRAPQGLAASAWHGKAMCLKSLQKPDLAIECFRQAVQLEPKAVPVWMDLANLLREEGKLGQVVECMEELTQILPGDADAQLNLGHALLLQDHNERALAAYQQASRLQPDALPTHKGVGDALLRLGRYKEAKQVYDHCFQMQFGSGYAPDLTLDKIQAVPPIKPGSRESTKVSAFYLEEVAGHVEYLLAKGLIDSSFKVIADIYRSYRAQMPSGAEPNQLLALTQQQSDQIRAFHRRAIRYVDTPAISPPLVNKGLDYRSIEDQYLSSPTAAIAIDEFLSKRALEALRSYCLESSIFFEQSASGFLSSYVHQGFNCSLLYGIAEELKTRFPRILGSLELRNMWVYRHPSQTGGVKAHTDQAAVTFNFWITADDANLDTDHGGLIVYLKEQPRDWDWFRFNYHKHDPDVQNQITAFLQSAETMTIPYRENRALLFHSNLFHKSDAIRFKDGYENRRMNITMLFGDRERHIGDGMR